MRSANLPREVARIKFRVRWIEMLHWRKLGLRLLWRSVLMNARIGNRKLKLMLAKKPGG